VTAVVESAVSTGTEVLWRTASTPTDADLIVSAENIRLVQERVTTAFQRMRQLTVIEEFLRAHAASREASERSHLTDTGGWGDDEAERLHGVAEDAWTLVADGWYVMEGSWAARLLVVDEAREAGAEYAGRHRRPVGRAVTQSTPTDWSRGR
jgi:hypothetical protein